MGRKRLTLGIVAIAIASITALGSTGVVYAAAPPKELQPNCVLVVATVQCTFSYSGTDGSDGSAQSFTTPAGVRTLTIEAWGAEGGGGDLQSLGGHAKGTITVAADAILAVRVGGQPTTAAGGFNGGGTGTPAGGGASDVRIGGDSVGDRVIVAGGGGGTGEVSVNGSTISLLGGYGGGDAGGDGVCDFPHVGLSFPGCGGGGSSSTGGAPGSSTCQGGLSVVTTIAAEPGSFGAGGNAATETCGAGTQTFTFVGAGGGGGWFGGGGGGASASLALLAFIVGGGGGGAGHVSPFATDTVNEPAVRSGSGAVLISYADTPPSKFACRHGGWRSWVNSRGRAFRDAKSCVTWVERHRKP
ncbi:MAG: hypothetical protein JWL83_2769 [Actinomycetia bacterium]|nr:hypothetical protein [Actinomycetes bacterium]